MYERFTDRARKVMQLANQEAQRFNHEYMGTEHILLGMLREGSGVAAHVLRNLHVDFDRVRQAIVCIIQNGPDMVTMGKLPQTPHAKKVIEYAIEAARETPCNYIGSEHILLGLLREGEGIACQVLMNLGVTLDRVMASTRTLLGVNPTVIKGHEVLENPLPETGEGVRVRDDKITDKDGSLSSQGVSGVKVGTGHGCPVEGKTPIVATVRCTINEPRLTKEFRTLHSVVFQFDWLDFMPDLNAIFRAILNPNSYQQVDTPVAPTTPPPATTPCYFVCADCRSIVVLRENESRKCAFCKTGYMQKLAETPAEPKPEPQTDEPHKINFREFF